MKILIVEDDPLMAFSIENMLNEMGNYEVIGICKNGTSALKVIELNKPHLILMDIKLEGSLNGIELARLILPKSIPIIFISSYDDYDYFNQTLMLPNCSFLIKPFHKFTLASTIHLLIPDWPVITPEDDDKELIYIKVGNKREIIFPKDIYWVESTRNYCTIQTSNNKFVVKQSLKALYAVLPERMFVFIHKSYFVRRALIKRIDLKNHTVSVNNKLLPLGRHYIKSLNEILLKLG
jgi:two-component system, LytTR family, response regulator LytT